MLWHLRYECILPSPFLGANLGAVRGSEAERDASAVGAAAACSGPAQLMLHRVRGLLVPTGISLWDRNGVKLSSGPQPQGQMQELFLNARGRNSSQCYLEEDAEVIFEMGSKILSR